MAILANDVGLKCRAVAYGGDIAQVNDRAVDLLDWDHAQLVKGARSRVRANVVFFSPDLCSPGRHDDVLRIECGQDVTWGDAL